jgi:hypothetical protein
MLVRAFVTLFLGLILFTSSAEARHRHHHAHVRHHVVHYRVVHHRVAHHAHHAHRSVRHIHRERQQQEASFAPSWFQSNPMFTEQTFQSPVQPSHFQRHIRRIHREIVRIAVDIGTTTMLAHPAGCPYRNFCGCGAAMETFGSPRRDLWAAAAWFRFPRAEAAIGNAVVRAHHVAILKEHISGSVWMAADYNSGRHLSRLHPVDIRRFSRIVNPRG